MADFLPHNGWVQLGTKLDTHLSDNQIAAFRHTIHLRQIREKKRRIAVGIAAIGLFFIGSLYFMVQPMSTAPDRVSSKTETAPQATSDPQPVSSAGEPQKRLVVPIAQKPIVEALVTGTRFTVDEEALRRVYHVASGKVRFETREGDTKPLEVRIGELVIEDIGTVFTTEALPNNRARIGVLEGRVRVTWPGGMAVLAENENGEFPPERLSTTQPKASEKESPRTKVIPGTDWRILARRGEYRRALGHLEQDPTIVANRVPDLLLAADVMRLSGNFEQAVSYLEKVIKGHRRNSRAKLAAFTLGRVYLDELGRPKEAARMFKKAGSGKSRLAEEALAREVEAWSRANATHQAREAAMLYLTRYPNGDRVNLVRAFGGLSE